MSAETTPAAPTLVALLRQQAERYGDRVAFRFCPDGDAEEDRLTFRELDFRARAIAARLQQQGAAGQRVLMICRPGLETIPAFFGCLYAGAVAVGVDDGTDLNQIAPDADADFVVATAKVHADLEATVQQLTGGRRPQWCVIDDAVRDGRAEHWVAPEIGPDTTAMLEYTSGSTGSPKGVLVSHRNVLSNIEAQHQVWGGDEQTVMLSWVALHRNAGLIAAIAHPIYLGCTAIVVSPVNFFARPMRWLEAISRHRATVTVAFSRAYAMCVRAGAAEAGGVLDLSCLSTATAGGEPISAADVHAFIETFAPAGFRAEALAPSYGLAQATLTVTGGSDSPVPVIQHLDRLALRARRVADAAPGNPFAVDVVSCGRPVPGVRIAIVDPQTLRVCGPDEVGEIWIAGPNIAQGYWRRPEETEHTFSAYLADTGDGPFLRSGDLGFLRGGELFLTGRWADLITIDNSNHYPGDIEATVQQCHPAFLADRTAAFAVQSDPAAENHLVVVQELDRAHQCSRAELAGAIDTARAQIANDHGIEAHAVVLVEPMRIPTTPTGKVRRSRCRQQFLDGTLDAVAEWHAAPLPVPPSRAGGPTKSADSPPILTRALGRVIERLLTGNRLKGQTLKSKFRYLYPYTTRQFESAGIDFLNYGYEEDPPLGLPLAECDEPNRPGIQLYHQTAAQVDLEAKDILEVSCGHGGGASYLVRTFHPASYTALDLNDAGIALCKRRHRLPGLEFVHGDAQQLPFSDRSFDAVINIEASHGYPDFPGFLTEVVRVLRPGGHFLYADLRRHGEIPAWEAAFAAAPLRLVSQRVVNEQTLRGLRQNSPRLIELIDTHATPQLRHFYREFAAVTGTQNYRNLEQGISSYRIYNFIKD